MCTNSEISQNSTSGQRKSTDQTTIQRQKLLAKNLLCTSVNSPMCLRENQHFHELDSHGSNAVVVRVEQLHDDLLHVDHEAPGRLHAVRDGLGLAQPFQRGPEK